MLVPVCSHAYCVLCVFYRKLTSEVQATYCCCFLIPVESILLLQGSSNEGIVVRRSPNFTVEPHQVQSSPILTVAPHHVTFHQSPVLCLPRVLRQSTLLCLLQVHRSLIFCVMPSTRVAPISTVVPSTSVATIVTVAPSTVAPFYSVAPFVSYHFVQCDYATRQFHMINNLATDVNMPCQLFALATTEHVVTCRRFYSTVVIQLH